MKNAHPLRDDAKFINKENFNLFSEKKSNFFYILQLKKYQPNCTFFDALLTEL